QILSLQGIVPPLGQCARRKSTFVSSLKILPAHSQQGADPTKIRSGIETERRGWTVAYRDPSSYGGTGDEGSIPPDGIKRADRGHFLWTNELRGHRLDRRAVDGVE